jgi:hypothetical protein
MAAEGRQPTAPPLVGPEENTEVVTFGLVAAAPDGTPVVIGIRDESQFGSAVVSLEVLAADREAQGASGTAADELTAELTASYWRAHDQRLARPASARSPGSRRVASARRSGWAGRPAGATRSRPSG